MKTLQEILDDYDFVEAPEGEKCAESNCSNMAIGELEWWNFGDIWDFPASTYYCKEHLLEKYKNFE